MQETFCSLLIAATALAAQSSSPSDWIGVWQGELDGQPSVTLTLAKDSGTLEGTLVLNIINRDSRSPRIVAHEAHVLLQTRSQGDSITFQVKRIDRSAEPMEFTVERTAADAAKIHCLNCGDDAPTVEMTKLD